MASELADDVIHLTAEGVLHLLVHGVDGAPHGEVLPDHDAVGIAEVEEGVILVDVTAPAADDIAPRLVQHLQRLGEPFGVAGMEGVQGDPVGTHGEHGLAVDDKAELTVIAGEGGAVQLHGTDTRLHGPLVHNDTATTQGDGHVVEPRPARVLGVPQVGPVDGDEDIAAGVPEVGCDLEGAVVAHTLHRDGVVIGQFIRVLVAVEGVVGVPAQVYGIVEIQLGVAAGVVGGIGVDRAGVEEGLPDGGGLDGLDVDGPPDAARHGAAEDVPSEGGGSLAGIEGSVAEGEQTRRGGDHAPLCLDHGGMNMYDQLVARGFQGHIAVQGDLIGHEHIFPAVYPFAVDIQIEDCVNAFQFQYGKLILRHGRQIKGGLVKQVSVLQLAEPHDIRPPIRILQQPRPHHVHLKIAGNNGGDGDAETRNKAEFASLGVSGGAVFLVGDDG